MVLYNERQRPTRDERLQSTSITNLRETKRQETKNFSSSDIYEWPPLSTIAHLELQQSRILQHKTASYQPHPFRNFQLAPHPSPTLLYPTIRPSTRHAKSLESVARFDSIEFGNDLADASCGWMDAATFLWLFAVCAECGCGKRLTIS